jgi:hypothetical protein
VGQDTLVRTQQSIQNRSQDTQNSTLGYEKHNISIIITEKHIRTQAAYQVTSSISGHKQHTRTQAAYQDTSSIPGHKKHIRTRAAYKDTSSISGHKQHIRTQAAYQDTSSTEHKQHIRTLTCD